MKLIIFSITLSMAVLTFQRCGKKDDALWPNTTTKVVVLEKGTRKPILGATVDLLHCSVSHPLLGCVGYDSTPVQSVKTDADGRASFSIAINGYGVRATHPDYWGKLKEDASTEILLSPPAWANLRMKRIASYNPGSTVYVSAARNCTDCGNDTFFLNYYQDIGLPADTTFTFPVEASENVTVSWFVTDPVSPANDKSGAAQPFILNKSDTIEIAFTY
jgi:hypothetical protein